MHACSQLASVRKARSAGETSTPRSSVSALASKHTLRSEWSRYGCLRPGYAASSRVTDKDHRYAQNLHEHKLITDDQRKNLLQIVLARTGGICDLDPIFQESVHQMVLSHNELSQDLPALRARLATQLEKLQKLWDPTALAYKP